MTSPREKSNNKPVEVKIHASIPVQTVYQSFTTRPSTLKAHNKFVCLEGTSQQYKLQNGGGKRNFVVVVASANTFAKECWALAWKASLSSTNNWEVEAVIEDGLSALRKHLSD
jgi:hypothetical protein